MKYFILFPELSQDKKEIQPKYFVSILSCECLLHSGVNKVRDVYATLTRVHWKTLHMNLNTSILFFKKISIKYLFL